jgi:hypothetical protein
MSIQERVPQAGRGIRATLEFAGSGGSKAFLDLEAETSTIRGDNAR